MRIITKTDIYQQAGVVVNKALGVMELVEMGKYQYGNCLISDDKYFEVPIEIGVGSYSVTLGLVSLVKIFPCSIVPSEIMFDATVRPATAVEVLSLGAQHPLLQRKWPMICLGGVWKSKLDESMPYCMGLGETAGGRHLRDYDYNEKLLMLIPDVVVAKN